jgi:hypothetical protein
LNLRPRVPNETALSDSATLSHICLIYRLISARRLDPDCVTNLPAHKRSSLGSPVSRSPPLPPCGEGMGVVRYGTAVPRGTTPHPLPPPQGGGRSWPHWRAETSAPCNFSPWSGQRQVYDTVVWIRTYAARVPKRSAPRCAQTADWDLPSKLPELPWPADVYP